MLYCKKAAWLEGYCKAQQAHLGHAWIYLGLCSVSWPFGSWPALGVLPGVCNCGGTVHDSIVSDGVFLVDKSACVRHQIELGRTRQFLIFHYLEILINDLLY